MNTLEETTLVLVGKRILVVDDEVSIRRVIETRLRMAGCKVLICTDGVEALNQFDSFEPHLVILDLMLPGMDGAQICALIRKRSETPILMLTAISDVTTRIQVLESGADDYLIKPFNLGELEARIKAILRRTAVVVHRAAQPSASNVVSLENLSIDLDKRQVSKKRERVRLTGMEFSVLELLVTNAGKPFSRNEILQRIWAYPVDSKVSDTRVVDVHISRLRAKLEDDASNPSFILTARGIGYMFQGL